MKKIQILLVAFLFAIPAIAQESIVGPNAERNGFVAPVINYTTLSNNWGIMAGLRGGIVMNKRLSLGGGIYGLGGSSIKSDASSNAGNTLYHQLTYGGFEVEYIFNPDSKIHYSIMGLFGLGNTSLRDTKLGADTDSNTIYVFEPGINAIANLTETIRFGLGLHYRLISGADTQNLNNSDIAGPSLAFMIKFGGI